MSPESNLFEKFAQSILGQAFSTSDSCGGALSSIQITPSNSGGFQISYSFTRSPTFGQSPSTTPVFATKPVDNIFAQRYCQPSRQPLFGSNNPVDNSLKFPFVTSNQVDSRLNSPFGSKNPADNRLKSPFGQSTGSSSWTQTNSHGFGQSTSSPPSFEFPPLQNSSTSGKSGAPGAPDAPAFT